MPPCRCVLSKDVFCFETSGAVPVLVKDTVLVFGFALVSCIQKDF